jgi:hypothetical protein
VVLNLIFAEMAKVTPTKPQRTFLNELFRVLLTMRGWVTFTRMARFSAPHEQTFRRHFKKAFGWVAFNLAMLRLRRHPRERFIGVFDCTSLLKSGRTAFRLDRFFSSVGSAAHTSSDASCGDGPRA